MRGDFSRSSFDPADRFTGVRLQQGRMLTDADWNEQLDVQNHARRRAISDIVGCCGAPIQPDANGRPIAGFEITIEDQEIMIGAGRCYVHGLCCDNAASVAFTAQADLPGQTLPDTDGFYLAYLGAWELHLTALDDPTIADPALHGVDTTTRTRIVWQVRLAGIGTTGPDAGCDAFGCSWTPHADPPTLEAQAVPGDEQTDPCIVPADAGYRRLENQLYRVEVHNGEDGPDGPTFKFSRENGSVVAGWENDAGANPDNVITIHSEGRDANLSFATGDWVEITDDDRELLAEPGLLVQLRSADGRTLTLDPETFSRTNDPGLENVDGTLTVRRSRFKGHPRIRRWESDGAVAVVQNEWIDLEDGVQVRFGVGACRTGQYWLIPARTSTGEVEWPQNGDAPASIPPHGVKHLYCPLAILRRAGNTWTVEHDCRRPFPTLTQLTALRYAGGDGQEAPAHPTQAGTFQPLEKPLAVTVVNGVWPVANATVRFTADQPAARLGSVLATIGPPTIPVVTGENGLAECYCQLAPQPAAQHVVAELLDASGEPVPGQTVRFTARLSQASRISNASTCPTIQGAATVQAALEALCQNIDTKDPGVTIKGVRLSDSELLNDALVTLDQVAKGITIACSDALDPVSVKRPTLSVVLEIPNSFHGSVAAYVPMVLAAQVSVAGSEMRWSPAPVMIDWIRAATDGVTEHLLVHLVARGNFIWSLAPTKLLDGDSFGKAAKSRKDWAGNLAIDLDPAHVGDGRRGGTFHMWFWMSTGQSASPGLKFSGEGVTTDKITFGTAAAPAASRTLAIQNASGQPILLSGASVTGTGFTLATPLQSVQLEPNQKINVVIRRTAQTAQTGTLTITGSANQAIARFDLQGPA